MGVLFLEEEGVDHRAGGVVYCDQQRKRCEACNAVIGSKTSWRPRGAVPFTRFANGRRRISFRWVAFVVLRMVVFESLHISPESDSGLRWSITGY